MIARTADGVVAEIVVVTVVFVAVAYAAAVMQQVTVTRYWDGDEYYAMAEQMAAGEAPHAAAPYVFRLATPWLVARLWPTQIVTGFRTVNLAAAAATTLLLLLWLRRWVEERWARLTAVVLFVIAWHGPARFVFYYPVYVDPLVFPFLIAGLMVIDRLHEEPESAGRGWLLAALTVICVAGTLCREVMAVVPIALLCDRRAARRAEPWAWLPLIATAMVIAMTRTTLHPRVAFSFIGTAFFHIRNKPIFTWVLAWFITFGPALALIADDWRAASRTLIERPFLAVYLVLFAGLAYIGGHDTERYLFWSMPVVYLLIGRALIASRSVLSNTYLAAVLIAAQLVSARLFWSVPSPSLAVAALGDVPPAARAYSILNRLFVIDDFHWNLWSNFGSRPFHALLLAIYLLCSGAMVFWMRARRRSYGH